jgi:microcystin-dependent protein
MPTNDYLPFCGTDTGSNLEAQASYVTDSQRTNGNAPGVARLTLVNKALRQGTFMAAALAQFVSDRLAVDVLDDANISGFLANLKNAISPVPSGSVLSFAGSAAPTGYLLCDGSAISRTTYATLFAAIGTVYGIGNGTTTFNIPNTQGVFLRGAGSQTISGISYTGIAGTAQGDQMQGHIHQQTFDSAGGGAAVNVGNFTGAPNNVASNNSTSGPNSDGTNGTPRTGSETRPANIGVNHIIKT